MKKKDWVNEQMQGINAPGPFKKWADKFDKDFVDAVMGEEVCLVCGGPLPPLDGSEENDFRTVCEDCPIDESAE